MIYKYRRWKGMDSKMKKALPYIKSLIFIVGLIVIIGVCDYCFAKTGYIHYILQHVNEDDENYDTIVLGASHARSAIDPAKIDSQADTVTLSMAIPGETLKDSYYVLEESCKNNDVKRVIFDVDYQYWFGPQEEGYFAETFIYNQFSWLSLTKWDYLIHNSEYMDIRSAFTKGGGSIGVSGCVSYMFDEKGQIILDKEEIEMDADDLMMLALDAGAEDFSEEEDSFEIITSPADFSAVRDALDKEGIKMASAEVTMIPQNYVSVTDDDVQKNLDRILDLLDADDDVQDVYTNVE